MRHFAHIILFLSLFTFAPLTSQAFAVFDPGLSPIEESKAFQQYQRRKDTTLSRLIYLIDRFKEADIKIIYEQNAYSAKIAGGFARAFLQMAYRDQTEEEWIAEHCVKTVFTKEKIWALDRYGRHIEGQKLLREELKNLEETLAKNQIRDQT